MSSPSAPTTTSGVPKVSYGFSSLQSTASRNSHCPVMRRLSFLAWFKSG